MEGGGVVGGEVRGGGGRLKGGEGGLDGGGGGVGRWVGFVLRGLERTLYDRILGSVDLKWWDS